MAAKFDSVRRLFGEADSNLAASTDDQERVRAYDVYEGIYWNNPNAYQLVRHGDDQVPFYIPAARKIVEACNRFLAVDFTYNLDPKYGSDQERQTTNDFIRQLFKRERFYSKFSSQKRHGLLRGDAIWHIIADRAKPAGRRLSIQDVKPHNYFPILDPDDPTKVIGCHLVNKVPDPTDPRKAIARRQTYRKIIDDMGNVQIESSLGLYEIGKWDDRYLQLSDISLVKQIIQPFILPGATSIPVYHIPNFNHGSDDIFGSSELRGIETAITAVNQSLSDEDLTLLMQGLGVYWTTAGPPKDADGNETDFNISPAHMLELPAEAQAGRLTGVSSVAPMLDHMKFILDETQAGIGIPDVAIGKIDVSVAESGISLALQLSPILANNAEKEQEMLGVYDNFFYDLIHYWLPEYEGLTQAAECDMVSVVGDPMPINRQAVIDEIVQLRTPSAPGEPSLITLEMAVKRLEELGWEYPPNALEQLVADAEKARAASLADPMAARMNEELSEADDPEE